jgi:hypothetical protein
MFVKPAEGRAVRDPASRALLPANCGDVPMTAFWLRRLRDKDVVEANAPKAEVESVAAAVALPAPEVTPAAVAAEEH